MITLAQRIEALRTERGLSRPALSQALGFPKNAAEKFETGRQTPPTSLTIRSSSLISRTPERVRFTKWIVAPFWPTGSPRRGKWPCPVIAPRRGRAPRGKLCYTGIR